MLRCQTLYFSFLKNFKRPVCLLDGNILCLFDTGANVVVANRRLGEQLSDVILTNTRVKLGGITGNVIETYLYKVSEFRLCQGSRGITFKSLPIHFVENSNFDIIMPSTLLCMFKVSWSYKDKILLLRDVDKTVYGCGYNSVTEECYCFAENGSGD